MSGIETVLGSFSGFKGRLLLFAGILAVFGLGLNSMYLLDSQDGVKSSNREAPSMRTDFTGRTQNLVEHSGSTTWGDAAIRLGLSFGIAMIFASLLKAFFRSIISFALIAAAVCWFLNSRGLIDPFWKDIDISGEAIQEWVVAQFDTAKGFVSGVLPSTGAAAVGFLFGLRK
ncbi:MAG: hypothetical protein P1U58_15735 [Verrucomicrobiales bacterium]|nr:hypothetical protein [Verrucomicrobiales bacterium]